MSGVIALLAGVNAIAGGSPFIIATGGTITTYGDFKVHTFNSSGTFTIVEEGLTNNLIDFLIVAGGGSSGKGPTSPNYRAGAGGAGGYRSSYGSMSGGGGPDESTFTGAVGSYTVTIGAGGSQASGAATSFYGQSSSGGGKGGNANSYSPGPASSGGSGGGASGGPYAASYGSGTSGQGTNGATGNPGGYAAGRGGGAQTNGAGGGAGIATYISDSTAPAVTYSEGLNWEVSGGANTGNGAGQAGGYSGATQWFNGGSGIVVINYKYQ